MHDKNVAFRLLVIVVLALGGMVFFPLFFAAAFVAWALYTDLTDPSSVDANASFVPRSKVTATDPDWKSYFLRDCESEAERAFLNIMVKVCELLPDKGALRSDELSMQLQVELPPYRVDFLVDDWLVVEIDGAAYHSSPEAIERDQQRDFDLQSRGYRVLRIPAKTVFDTPVLATRQVRGARMDGRPGKTAETARQPRSLGQALESIDNFVTDLNSYVHKSMAVQAAMKQTRETFDLEKTAIDSAVKIAVRRQEHQARRAQSAEFARQLDVAYAEIAALFDDDKPIARQIVPAITAPQPHSNPIIDAEIRRAHQDLLNDRSQHFQSVRERLNGDQELGAMVKNALEEMGYPDCWHSIAI